MTVRIKGKAKTNPTDSSFVRLTWIIGTALIVLSVIASGLFLFQSWAHFEKAASSEAITLAQSLETLLQPEHIVKLPGEAADLEKPEYIITKRNLMQLAEKTNSIKFAYLMSMKDDSIVFLLDSESPDSPAYHRLDRFTQKRIRTHGMLFDWEKQFYQARQQTVGGLG